MSAPENQLAHGRGGDELQRFRRGCIGLLALGGVSQYLIQTQSFRDNPAVLVPSSDAGVIWERAGEIAGGSLVDSIPFDTAPLVLWTAALVRSLGGDLLALGVLQSCMYLATALMVAVVGRRLARGLDPAGGSGAAGVGLLAGALYLLLGEPAAATSRVLSGTLQLFLGSALLVSLSGLPAGPVRAAGSGALLGLFCLAYPPMLVGVPVLMIWLFVVGGRTWPAPLAMGAAAALAIAPATLHNYRAAGEWIPISSQAGLTFYHGNNEEAQGTIAPIGVVNSKEEQALDSLERARDVLGPDAGWKDASGFWMGKGLSFWGEHPVDGMKLAATKLWYFVSGRRYGDVYQPWRERDDGVASRLWLAPLPLAWLVPLGLLMGVLLIRNRPSRARSIPLLVFLAVPLAVVVAFFYTPRYRLPGALAMVPLCALALGRLQAPLTPGPKGRGGAVLMGAALLLGILSGPLNRAMSFDGDPDGHFRERFLERMAAANGKLDRHGDALGYMRQLMDLRPENPELQGRFLDLLWFTAASADPDVFEPEAALAAVEQLLGRVGPAPGLLDLRGTARANLGDFAGALADAGAALGAMDPADPARLEVEGRRAMFERGEPFRLPPPTD